MLRVKGREAWKQHVAFRPSCVTHSRPLQDVSFHFSARRSDRKRALIFFFHSVKRDCKGAEWEENANIKTTEAVLNKRQSFIDCVTHVDDGF